MQYENNGTFSLKINVRRNFCMIVALLATTNYLFLKWCRKLIFYSDQKAIRNFKNNRLTLRYVNGCEYINLHNKESSGYLFTCVRVLSSFHIFATIILMLEPGFRNFNFHVIVVLIYVFITRESDQ